MDKNHDTIEDRRKKAALFLERPFFVPFGQPYAKINVLFLIITFL